MCFEVLGFDILIDSCLKPWVIEINISPSFHVDTPLDFRIKKGVIEECIKLLNLSYKRKQKFKKKEKTEFQKRVFSGKIEKKTQEQRIIAKQDLDTKRHIKVNNTGLSVQEAEVTENYRLIYPNLEMEVYENFMNTAKLVWEEFTGSGNQPNKNPVVKVPERAKSNVVLRQKRNRPSSAFPQNRIQKFST